MNHHGETEDVYLGSFISTEMLGILFPELCIDRGAIPIEIRIIFPSPNNSIHATHQITTLFF
jgi:hypothetical protein